MRVEFLTASGYRIIGRDIYIYVDTLDEMAQKKLN